MKFRFIIPGLIFLIVSGCSFFDFVDDASRPGGINIYIVGDGQLSKYETEVDLNTLELERNPWVSMADIAFYDWSAHIFYLRKDKERERYSGRHFLVKWGDEPLFLGYFFPPFSSALSFYPSVIAADNYMYSDDVIEIGGIFGGFHDEAMDKNARFKKALKETGLFREGIHVELTSAHKKNASTVEYTLEITNLENKNIYVFDPDKMGSPRFHYYTNGVSFTKDGTSYYANSMEVTASEGVFSSWYCRLSPGKSITRTIELSGFDSLPSGKVNVRFHFPGYPEKSGKWKKSDGRVWLGSYWIEQEITMQ